MNKALIIAKFTFKEILKSKILLNTLVLGVVLFIITYVAYNFTYGEPQRIALDFGLGVLSLSSVGIAIFFGVGLLSNEIESRTVYMIISRPVSRHSFYLGKVLGLTGILILNIFLLSVMTLCLYFFIGGTYSPVILWSIFFIMIEAIIVLLTISLLTIISTQTISVLGVLIIYVSGHAIPAAQSTSFAKLSPVLTKLLDIYHFLLPGFYKFNIKNYVIYKQELALSFLSSTFLYAIFYACFLILIGCYFFNKKNLD